MARPVLNQKQTAVLEFIKFQIVNQGYPPSVREIGAALEMSSSSTVHGYLRQLEALGYLYRDPAKPRAMVVTQSKESAEESQLESPHDLRANLNLPIIDDEALCESGFDLNHYKASKMYSVTSDLLQNKQAYLFKMPDDSMIKIGIFPGDHLIIELVEAKNGDVVLARVRNELTVKTYFKGLRQIRLQPENDWQEPLFLTDDDYHYIGRVYANIRHF